MRFPLLASFACVLLLFACKQKQRHITRGFYYWKTAYELSPYESNRLKTLNCERLYVRCFDIALVDGKPAPVGIIRHLQAAPGMAQVPVVFITQDALRSIAPDEELIAAKVSGLLAEIFRNMPLPDEVQIDCDWTARTKEAYFRLLSALRRQPFFQHKRLSCTIRLHQIKYRLQSGIPPVDRGLLMCYNMGNLKRFGNRNSILDVPLAKQYLKEASTYPLRMDVALPIFRWCVQFRDGKMLGIMRDVPPEAVAASGLFRKESSSLYQALSDTTWYDYTLRAGDIIRTEDVSRSALQELADYTARQVQDDSLRVLLFHADSLTLSKYSDDELKAVFSAFH